MKTSELILAIETSCDETAAAVIEGGRIIRSNIVASQIESHKRFGGVVPEIASRHHVEQITLVIEEAIQQAGIQKEELDAIAVTQGPGLIGALLVGVNAAKALAFSIGKPLIGVHHIAGHIYANRLEQEFVFPLLALVVSGGHTELVLMKEHGSFEVIGETRDDAAGEAYDKVARTLQLPYPGGPRIDKLAAEGEQSIDFPRAWLEPESYDFSFSGLKSAVINTLHNAKQKGETFAPADVAASFQASVVDVLVGKTIRAAEAFGAKQVIVAGGVAANRGLRASLEEVFADKQADLLIPPLALCTDNAAMIGAAASILYQQEKFADLSMNAKASMPL
ncbi:tRNA (adenosine(37)-N6)-threonylcarbamoyltransferase complex transferase subunit TsaD [Terribacillus saccharophilus]|uniref:tRNA N6-adenosine threonylcarbamoyltransferase n=1 Tax=Terribacillus saccharophilus TaxID=361277 RepID=A0A268ABQ2_9BACI|nr:tRNA (adenosine(37)-N6)-threonylcarbamoyltransferase complex transferase subunit TsaD [Terribacillus saccharophilus]PAD21548.1 tRNA (adenosine(37)-N6)-threonylcarbamoyltransferase complex transferase subunit TsaD [Terribacillus saccharophilus]PAF16348.1 tRNA (adenosine(37)-N6)-threonylcarbamoyltransferase complex transferase subunit TsaD [Terribacillus saccharophilus]PAF21171.1 tRNA (adenosine(37)-N6)-threonylcarbamoyltransferase complex transferase subunit TsaD [Terribacillus saccharophilus]